ncbi:MAG: hypothetical protein ACRENP_13605 [Longimicrobiales bacterium]
MKTSRRRGRTKEIAYAEDLATDQIINTRLVNGNNLVSAAGRPDLAVNGA